MNKFNKKGFTLIEMLVVIAIIAVLVAIIIPTVSSATDKAAAATNAANLRSYKAELTTALLSGEIKTPADKATAVEAKVSGEPIPTAPESKAVGKLAKGVEATFVYDAAKNSFTVKFGNSTINDFALVADGTNAPTEIPAAPAKVTQQGG